MIVTHAAKAGGTVGAEGQMGTHPAKGSLKASPGEVPREWAWREPVCCRRRGSGLRAWALPPPAWVWVLVAAC